MTYWLSIQKSVHDVQLRRTAIELECDLRSGNLVMVNHVYDLRVKEGLYSKFVSAGVEGREHACILWEEQISGTYIRYTKHQSPAKPRAGFHSTAPQSSSFRY